MEQEKIRLVYKKRAAFTIAQVAWHVAGKGYPETALILNILGSSMNSEIHFLVSLISIPFAGTPHITHATFIAHYSTKHGYLFTRLKKRKLVIYYVIHTALLS